MRSFCPSLTSLAIGSISRSIRLRAANFPPIWVWNTWFNLWLLKFIQDKTNTDALRTAPGFQLRLEVCKHKVIITCILATGKGIIFALLMLDLKPYWTKISIVVFLNTGGSRCNIHIKLIWKSHWPLHEGPWHWNWSHGLVSFDGKSFSNEHNPEKHHDKYCIYNQICIHNYTTLCWMTLTLYHQGHCGTLWPVINNVQLEHELF